MVSLDICSDSLSLSELSLKMGRRSTKTSHDKDELRHNGESFGTTIWRLESAEPADAPIKQHLKSIVEQFPPDALLHVLPGNCEVYLNLGVLYDIQVTCAVGVELDLETVDIVHSYRANLEITCYPVDPNL